MQRRKKRMLAAASMVAALALWCELGAPLTMPLPGSRLYSTFGAPRSGGRTHEGVDIFAARGTPIRAATWGVVVWRGELSLGGRVLYVFGRRGMLTYYAHLHRWADVHPGDWIAEGEVLGYVGQTGNARTTPPHLHFETHPLSRLLAARDPVEVIGAP
ncbi:MAG: M23 family metallopeptidase [Myxococcota bacterium]